MDTHQNEADEALFAAIGKLTVTWAHLEGGLDLMIQVIFHDLDNPPGEKEVPKALSRKIRYLKRAFKKLPVSEDDRTRYDQLFQDIQTESIVRHDIIHGFIFLHTEGTGQAKAVRFLQNKLHLDHKLVHLDTASIMEAAIRAKKLASFTMNWPRLIREPLEEERQQSGEQNH
jgi:hypothetical protein